MARHDVKVHYGKEVVNIDSSDKSLIKLTVKETTDNKEQKSAFNAKFVIGADGGHSFVRHAFGVQFEGETEDQTFYNLDCKNHSSICILLIL